MPFQCNGREHAVVLPVPGRTTVCECGAFAFETDSDGFMALPQEDIRLSIGEVSGQQWKAEKGK